MAQYKSDIVDVNLNTGNIRRSFLNHSIGQKDDDADRFGIRAFRDGVPQDLSGCSCHAWFTNSQGTTLALTSYGTVDGNEAYVTLPQACYDYEGQFCLAIKLVGGGISSTVRIIDGMVNNIDVGGAVSTTSEIPDYSDILAQYDAMVAATSAANTAIAETFDATKAYPTGKYVINEGALYRLTADHAANVTWSNTSKVAAKFGDDLADLKSAFDFSVGQRINLLNYELTTGYIKNDTGGTSSSSNWKIPTNFIYINDAEKILFTCPGSTSSSARNALAAIAFYKEANQSSYITGSYIQLTNTNSLTVKFVSVPQGAKFIKFTIPVDLESSYYIYPINIGNKNSALYQIEKYNTYNLMDMCTLYSGSQNGIDWTVNSDGSITFDGEATGLAGPGFVSSSFVPDWVELGKNYAIKFEPEGTGIGFSFGGRVSGTWKNSILTRSGIVYIPEDATGFVMRYNIPSGTEIDNQTVKVSITKILGVDENYKKTTDQFYSANSYNILQACDKPYNEPVISNNVKWMLYEDGTLHAEGTASPGSSFYDFYFSNSSVPDWLLTDRYYYVHTDADEHVFQIRVMYYKNGAWTSSGDIGNGLFVPSDIQGFGLRGYIPAGVTVDDDFHATVTTAYTNEQLGERVFPVNNEPRVLVNETGELGYPAGYDSELGTISESLADIKVMTFNTELYQSLENAGSKISNYKKMMLHEKADILLLTESYTNVGMGVGAPNAYNTLHRFLYPYYYGGDNDTEVLTKEFKVIPFTAEDTTNHTETWHNCRFPKLPGTGYENNPSPGQSGYNPSANRNAFTYAFVDVKGKTLLLISAHLRPSGLPNPFMGDASNTKGPLDDRKFQMNYLMEWVRTRHGDRGWDYCIIGGDFNTDNVNGTASNGLIIPSDTDDYDNLKDIMDHYGFKPLNGGDIGWFVTHPSVRSQKGSTCLDNIIVSSNVRLKDIRVDENAYDVIGSDHLPMMGELQLCDGVEPTVPETAYDDPEIAYTDSVWQYAQSEQYYGS